MFGSKKSKSAPVAEKKSTSRNVIGQSTKIIGDIVSQGDFRIDGHLEGNLKTDGRVIIGKEGFIKGKIECANADVEGKVSGEFVVHNILTAKSTSVISGDVAVGQISTDPGATFNATCNMRGAVKDINTSSKTDQSVKSGKMA